MRPRERRYESQDDRGDDQQERRVLLIDQILTERVLGVKRRNENNVVDVVSVLQGNHHQVQNEENRHERHPLHERVQPVARASVNQFR